MINKKQSKIKFKEIENSKLIIKEVVDEQIDEFGRKIIKFKEFEATGEVNLGSMLKPNKKIIEIKYKVPAEEDNIFGRLFKK